MDLLVDPEPHIVRGSPSWLIFPDLFPAHRVLAARCGKLLGQLEPQPAIAERVTAFRARHFRPLMVGVHARRGDFVRHRPDRAGNTAEMLVTVDRLLRRDARGGHPVLLRRWRSGAAWNTDAP